MNKWLDEVKQLDTKNPGGWPWPIKMATMLIIFVLIIIGSYVVVYQAQLEDLGKEEKQEVDSKAVFLEKKKMAVNLDAYQQQLADIGQTLSALLKQLPIRSEMDALVVEISQAALGRGLQVDLFKPAASDTLTEFYAEKPINLKVNGNYHDLGAFASDIAKLPRIVLLNDLNIVAGKDNLLSMEVVAKTYRYLDPEEIASQRKTAKPGAPKPGAK